MADLRVATAMSHRRQRKKPHQVKMLLEAFAKNPVKWSIEECIDVGDSVGLDRDQVSKWNWDIRKQQNLDTTRRTGQLKKSIPSKALIAKERARQDYARAKLADSDQVKIALSALPNQRVRRI